MRQEQFTTVFSGRLDRLITERVENLSRSRAAQLVREGLVTVDGEPVVKPSHKVAAHSVISLTVPPAVPIDAAAEDLDIDIVYQDADLVVVNKAAGVVVHPGAGHPSGTLVNALLFHIDDLSGIGGAIRPGIVHRLDKGTSGLLVVAKNDKAHQALAAQFANKTAGREYLALCFGAPKEPSGSIKSDLARHPTQRKRWASTERGGRPAVTHWSVLAKKGTLFLANCSLETGRTHQIRVHMTEKNWPLVGDGTYKRRNTRVPASIKPWIDPEGSRPMLHAWKLSLVHPSSGEVTSFVAKPPEDMMSCLRALAFESILSEKIRD